MLRLDMNLVFTIINLLIWYVIIRKFLFKPINNVINKREEAIQARYSEAQKLQEEAEAEKKKCSEFQNQIEEEKARVMAEAQENARAEYNNMMEDARKKADQIVEAARREAELDKEKIVGKAEQEIRSMIMEVAVRAMQDNHQDGRLYDQFLTKAGETTHAEHK